MNNTYRNIKDYAFSEHSEAFKILRGVFDSFSIKYFLIGAQARDIHFYQKGIKPIRGTRDIDFAIMVEDMKHYEGIMNSLKKNGFRETKDPYRLTWGESYTIIDLLPYGQIEVNSIVNFDKWDIELSVSGFRELNDELQEFYIDDNHSISIPVSPLHGIFLLKLLSWDDKKSDREKDLKDLYHILINYWEFVEDEAYEKHLDLFDDEEFKIEKAAAIILGRHLNITLEKSRVLKKKVIQILREQVSQIDPPGPMLIKFANEKDRPIEEVKRLLNAIISGIV